MPETYRLPVVALPRFLDDAARDFPDHPALVAGGDTIDYARLRDRVDETAGGLAAGGVGPDDRVLLALPPLAATPVLLFAIWRLGAVAVPVPPGTDPARTAEVATDAAVAAVAAGPDQLRGLADHDALPPLALAVTGDEWSRRRRWVRQVRRRGLPGPAVHLADVPASPARHEPGASTSPAVLVYGDGGPPRGVVLTHANLVAGAFQARLWVPDVQAGHERVLVADGPDDLAALTCGLLAGVLAGATLVLADDPSPRALARTVARTRPTLFTGHPSRLAALATAGEVSRRDLTSLRVCLAVGGPLEAQVAADLARATGGARVREAYGPAGTAAVTHAQPVYGRVDRGTVGLPVTGTTAVVVDPDDRTTPRPPDRPGRLLVTGPQVPDRVWRRPPETPDPLLRDGWLVTDDLFTVDDRGVFTCIGPLAEVVDRKGAFVSVRRAELALELHPAVRRAAVVAAGDHLTAAVVLRRRPRATAEDLLAHCRAHLDPAAVPDDVRLMDELPETAAGEVARDQLRRELAGR